MEELIRTNDPVLISFVQALLRDSDIPVLVADENMSIMEGSIGMLPRRILVPSDDLDRARRLMVDAGVGKELKTP